MPDHVHFLAEARAEGCDLLKLVDAFKQRTGYEYRRRHECALWQPRFYDHVLRRSDPIEGVALYIWMNPVRKNLCVDPRAYPLSGSETIEWMSKIESGMEWMPPWHERVAAKTAPG